VASASRARSWLTRLSAARRQNSSRHHRRNKNSSLCFAPSQRALCWRSAPVVVARRRPYSGGRGNKGRERLRSCSRCDWFELSFAHQARQIFTVMINLEVSAKVWILISKRVEAVRARSDDLLDVVFSSASRRFSFASIS
jgi:hypothetical protein